MDIQSLKLDLINWLTNLQDKAILKQLQGLKEQDKNSILMSADQESELERRIQHYENGDSKFSSWEDVKQRVKDKAKDVL
ncbi:Putative addiction module component [Belliella baltica DSM 15883]|uniref:Putative addiction module component n=1 Tax=Belliella baltica (strain DSM 15883 / CIP 108006 / LMG 21964 / BA134) TaxID=866536 RepID=I3Z0G4_BELBD|nr:addiction module protein [Belliella baltica]AFL82732.1 Putative addiction module component [Belliella baltica DSM 15883]